MMKTTTAKVTDWTTDDKIKESIALGFEHLLTGEDRMGRSYLSGSGKCISFRMLKLKEAVFAQASKKKPRATAKKARR